LLIAWELLICCCSFAVCWFILVVAESALGRRRRKRSGCPHRTQPDRRVPTKNRPFRTPRKTLLFSPCHCLTLTPGSQNDLPDPGVGQEDGRGRGDIPAPRSAPQAESRLQLRTARCSPRSGAQSTFDNHSIFSDALSLHPFLHQLRTDLHKASLPYKLVPRPEPRVPLHTNAFIEGPTVFRPLSAPRVPGRPKLV
jgi:hypothetical protein